MEVERKKGNKLVITDPTPAAKWDMDRVRRLVRDLIEYKKGKHEGRL